MEGPIKACAYHLFMFVSSEDRGVLLADMREWHEAQDPIPSTPC